MPASPDPERLKELLRQREQLEREIARASGAASEPAPAQPANLKFTAKPAPLPATPAADPDIEKFITPEEESSPLTKQGCWIAFSALMAVFIGIVALIWYVHYR